MAITYNMKGTSFASFTIGKQGVTVLQGTIDPVVGQGVNGDLFLQAGATPALWQKVAGAWNKIGNFGSKIFTDDTNVDTAEVADTITFNVDGTRIIDVTGDVLAINGEKLTIKNGNTNVQFVVSDTSTTNPVDLIFDLQGTGSLKIQSDADSAIRTSDGSDITLQPGDKTVGAGGDVVLKGGVTTAAGQAGGDIQLVPGAGGAGAAAGQILASVGYLPTTENSVVTRLSVTDLLVKIVTAESTYNVPLNEQVILVDRAGSTGVILPVANVPVGHQIKVKEATGSQTVTVSVNGGGTVDGEPNVALVNYEKATFVWSGTAWFTI
ncbi:hypothetical protein D3C71_1141940 [compost metagenome]